ncbi:MAG: SH3 domain-containing protein [Leptolyngbyaceae cyanobacterium]
MVWNHHKTIICNSAIAGLFMAMTACQPATPPTAPDSSPTSSEESASIDEDTDAPPTDKPSEPAATAPPIAEPEPETPAAPAATPEQSCSASAYVADTDPAGLNVRSGPSSEFEVQTTLPTSAPVEVSIVGFTNGWFLVNEAYAETQQALSQPGWIYGPLLGVSTTSLNINNPDAPTTLYAAPSGDASVQAEIPKYSEVTLLSCTGNWLEVQAPEATGWLAVGEQCSNPTSTCP